MKSRSVLIIISLVLIAAVWGCASTDVKRSAGQYIDDGVISAKVKTNLATDPITKAHQIDVDTYKGVVQLAGFVDTKESVARAEQIARQVKGVLAVKNDLIVR